MKYLKRALCFILSLCTFLTMSVGAMAATTQPAKDGYDYSIVMIDCGRKYFSVANLETVIDQTADAGMNCVMLGIGNDGMRFLLDDMSITVNGTSYSSTAVSNAIHTGNENYSNFTVDELTESDMDTLIAYANDKGVEIIPMINTPGHMDAILSAAASLSGKTCSYNGSARTIDVTNSTATAFTKAILQKYIDYFAQKGCTMFNMGCDEYANDVYTSGSMGFGNLQSSGKYSYYVTYVNEIAAMVESAGMTPMAFNDGFYFNNVTSSGTFDTNIMICYWSNGWSGYSPASATYLADKGFKMINANSDYYWVLGKSDWQCTASKASGFSYTSFPGSTISNPAGAMFLTWCDYPQADSDTNVVSAITPVIAAFGTTLPEVSSRYMGTPQPKEKTITLEAGSTYAIALTDTLSETPVTEDSSIATVSTGTATFPGSEITYTASASASVGVWETYYTSNLIDGDTSTYYWSNQAPAVGDYAQVDIGAPIQVDAIRLSAPSAKSTTDLCINAAVEVSADGSTWTNIGSYTEVSQSSSILTVPSGVGNIQYIRVRITQTNSNYWWQLAEIEWGSYTNGTFTRTATTGTTMGEPTTGNALIFTGVKEGTTYATIGNTHYTIIVTASTAPEPDPDPEPTYSVPTASVTAVKSGTSRVKMTGSIDDFENIENYYTITGRGLVYITQSKLGTRTLTLTTSGRTKVSFGTVSSTGTFSYTLRPSGKATGYVCRAWLTYTDDDGDSVTVYSDTLTFSYNGL